MTGEIIRDNTCDDHRYERDYCDRDKNRNIMGGKEDADHLGIIKTEGIGMKDILVVVQVVLQVDCAVVIVGIHMTQTDLMRHLCSPN